MTSAQSWSRDWADVITGLSRRHPCRFSDGYISLSTKNYYISFPCRSKTVTNYISAKSKPKYACLPSKIVEVWIKRFFVRYDWWRRLQPTSSVSPVWVNASWRHHAINTLRPRQNARHFLDDIFKYIFLNENVWISIKISLFFIPNGPIHNIPAMVQKMAWRRPGDKPLSEQLRVSSLTHICIIRPQWVKWTSIDW